MGTSEADKEGDDTMEVMTATTMMERSAGDGDFEGSVAAEMEEDATATNDGKYEQLHAMFQEVLEFRMKRVEVLPNLVETLGLVLAAMRKELGKFENVLSFDEEEISVKDSKDEAMMPAVAKERSQRMALAEMEYALYTIRDCLMRLDWNNGPKKLTFEDENDEEKASVMRKMLVLLCSLEEEEKLVDCLRIAMNVSDFLDIVVSDIDVAPWMKIDDIDDDLEHENGYVIDNNYLLKSMREQVNVLEKHDFPKLGKMKSLINTEGVKVRDLMFDERTKHVLHDLTHQLADNVDKLDANLTEIRVTWDDDIMGLGDEADDIFGYGAFGELRMCNFDGGIDATSQLVKFDKELPLSTRREFQVELQRWRDWSEQETASSIPELFGTVIVDKELYIISGKHRENLKMILKSDQDLDRNLLTDCIREIANALMFLHRSANVIHGKVCADNVLISDGWNIQLANFGFNIAKTELDILHPRNLGVISPFSPPELIGHHRGVRLTTNADIYAFGVLMWQILLRAEPFGDLTPHAFVERIVVDKNTGLDLPFGAEAIPSEYDYLIKSCTRFIALERPSILHVADELEMFADTPSPSLMKWIKKPSKPEQFFATLPGSYDKLYGEDKINVAEELGGMSAQEIIEMLNHEGDDEAVLKALIALQVLASFNDTTRDKLFDMDALDNIGEILNSTKYRKDQKVLVAVFELIRLLAKSEFCRTIIDENMSISVLDAQVEMQDDRRVVEAGMHALVQMSVDSNQSFRTNLVGNGIIQYVVAMLKEYDDSPSIIANACIILWLFHDVNRAQNAIAKSITFNELSAILEMHSDREATKIFAGNLARVLPDQRSTRLWKQVSLLPEIRENIGRRLSKTRKANDDNDSWLPADIIGSLHSAFASLWSRWTTSDNDQQPPDTDETEYE